MPGALSQALIDACQRGAGSPALQGEQMLISFAQLASAAQALATRLRDAGLAADEPVQVAVSNLPQDIVALLGVWLAGGVVVAVHRSTPPALAAALQQRTGARWGIDLSSPDIGADALQRLAAEPPPPRPLLVGAALIIFTSGSTGVPKGVVIGHDAFLGKINQIDRLLRLGADDRTLLVLNLSFAFGLWVALLTLLRGGTLVMAPKFEPASFLQTLADQRITRVGMVPTMMRVVFADPSHRPAVDRVVQQGSLRQIWLGGEALGLSLAQTIRQTFAGTDLVDIYGLTETATCDFFAFAADFAAHPGCIGRPSPQVRFRIVDAAGHPVVAGAVGELQIRSPYLMAGYLDAPELTAASHQDGWFKTGDLGCERGDQVVELMGRQKEVISRGGNKVTPVEIEQALCAHADVAAAMAVGVADALLGERIHVLIVARAGASIDLGAIGRHLEPRLERFKQPDSYYQADALPLGRTGKADRGQFKALIAAGDLQPLPR